MAHVRLLSPAARARDEGQSKLLHPSSTLYAWIANARTKLNRAGIPFDARFPHIEVMKRDEKRDDAVFNARATQLEGAKVALRPAWLGTKALVLMTPAVAGYGPTHATIAYFTGGLTLAQRDAVERLLG